MTTAGNSECSGFIGSLVTIRAHGAAASALFFDQNTNINEK